MILVKAIPDGYNSVTPYILVQGALIDFRKKVFDVKEIIAYGYLFV